jgi:hypothetical protein
MVMNLRSIIFTVLIVIAATLSGRAQADVSNCQDVYVGRIWVDRDFGLRAVVVINTPQSTGGSYWIYFDNWSADPKKSALATLTAAKMSGHRLHVATEEADQCGIATGGTQMRHLYLATNP